VFLALARNGRAVQNRAALAPWLYGAAFRVCLKARRGRTQSRATNRLPERPAPGDPLAELSAREFLAIVDDELACLPDRFRFPLVLCLIDGLSQEEAAARLGWSPGSVKGRLERGREKLRRRLAARGVSLAALLTAMAVSAPAAVPPALSERAAEAASGGAGAGGGRPPAGPARGGGVGAPPRGAARVPR